MAIKIKKHLNGQWNYAGSDKMFAKGEIPVTKQLSGNFDDFSVSEIEFLQLLKTTPTVADFSNLLIGSKELFSQLGSDHLRDFERSAISVVRSNYNPEQHKDNEAKRLEMLDEIESSIKDTFAPIVAISLGKEIYSKIKEKPTMETFDANMTADNIVTLTPMGHAAFANLMNNFVQQFRNRAELKLNALDKTLSPEIYSQKCSEIFESTKADVTSLMERTADLTEAIRTHEINIANAHIASVEEAISQTGVKKAEAIEILKSDRAKRAEREAQVAQLKIDLAKANEKANNARAADKAKKEREYAEHEKAIAELKQELIQQEAILAELQLDIESIEKRDAKQLDKIKKAEEKINTLRQQIAKANASALGRPQDESEGLHVE